MIDEKGLSGFTAYFTKYYGPDTIIGDPKCHAPALYRAAIAAYKAQVNAQPVAVKPAGVASIDLMRDAAKAAILRNGWKHKDRLALHSAIELMAAFAVEVAETGEGRCGWPTCGCDYDASCTEAKHTALVAEPAPQPADERAESRKTFTVPDGYEPVLGPDGRATGEVRRTYATLERENAEFQNAFAFQENNWAQERDLKLEMFNRVNVAERRIEELEAALRSSKIALIDCLQLKFRHKYSVEDIGDTKRRVKAAGSEFAYFADAVELVTAALASLEAGRG